MFIAYLVFMIVAVVANAAAAAVDFARTGWIMRNMTRYGLPHSWLFPLGLLKAAGAVGLLVGFVVPQLGLAAAAGLVVYFTGALVVVARARWFAHLPSPAAFLVLAGGCLLLQKTAV